MRRDAVRRMVAKLCALAALRSMPTLSECVVGVAEVEEQ